MHLALLLKSRKVVSSGSDPAIYLNLFWAALFASICSGVRLFQRGSFVDGPLPSSDGELALAATASLSRVRLIQRDYAAAKQKRWNRRSLQSTGSHVSSQVTTVGVSRCEPWVATVSSFWELLSCSKSATYSPKKISGEMYSGYCPPFGPSKESQNAGPLVVAMSTPRKRRWRRTKAFWATLHAFDPFFLRFHSQRLSRSALLHYWCLTKMNH